MEKRQLIEEIQRLNTTATVRFLRQFDAEALRQYLNHLVTACERQAMRIERAMSRQMLPRERIAV